MVHGRWKGGREGGKQERGVSESAGGGGGGGKEEEEEEEEGNGGKTLFNKVMTTIILLCIRLEEPRSSLASSRQEDAI